MLINLFDIENGVLRPSIACYAIPWLKRIMKEYPDDYIQVYSYIFFMTCPDGSINPYVNTPEEDKEAVILNHLAPIKFEFSLEDDLILDTIERCKKMYETPVLRTFKAAGKMLDKIAIFLDTAEITTGKDGNENAIRAMMKELSTYWQNYYELENQLKKEHSKVKGDKAIPYHQKDDYKESKNYDTL